MITPTQKRFIEIPLLIVFLWAFQALEISLLRLPFRHGAIQLVPVLVTYFALTRSWLRLGLLTLVFAFLGSFTVGYSVQVFVAVQMWTALFTKIVVSEFALEGRRPFTFLVVGSHIFAKVLTFLVLSSMKKALPFGAFLGTLSISVVAAGLLAWFLFPLCVWWDHYFDHPVHESRELNPDILR